jgi:hypothetical protein
MRSRGRVLLPNFCQALRGETRRKLHERRPQSAMHERHLTLDEPADQHLVALRNGVRYPIDLFSFGMSPPTAANRLTCDGRREARYRSSRCLQYDAVSLDECEALLRSHVTTIRALVTRADRRLSKLGNSSRLRHLARRNRSRHRAAGTHTGFRLRTPLGERCSESSCRLRSEISRSGRRRKHHNPRRVSTRWQRRRGPSSRLRSGSRFDLRGKSAAHCRTACPGRRNSWPACSGRACSAERWKARLTRTRCCRHSRRDTRQMTLLGALPGKSSSPRRSHSPRRRRIPESSRRQPPRELLPCRRPCPRHRKCRPLQP